MEAMVSGTGRLCVPQRKVPELFGVRLRELKRRLTARTPQFKGPDLVARGYEEVELGGEAWVALPRRLAAALAPGECANLLPPNWGELVPGGAPPGAIELYPYQAACVAAAERELLSPELVACGAALGYLNLPAGRGKTLVGVELARRVGRRCAVLAPRRQIGEQWRQTFLDHVPGVRVAVAGDVPAAGRAAALAAAGAVVLTPGMALRLQADPAFWAGFGLVLIDEAHMLCAQAWRRVLEQQTAPRVLGLSATTEDRPDGMDPVAKWHLGEPLHARDLPGYDAMDVEFYGRLRVVEVRDPALERHLRGLSHAAAQQELHHWRPWAAAVVAEVCGLLRLHEREDLREGRPPAPPPGARREDAHNVLVFCEHREAVEVYAEALQAQLGRGAVAAPEVAGMMGGTDPAAAARALAEARVIITTFSYSAVGVSLDRFTAAVFATTRKSQLYQIMARVLRVRSDTGVRRDYVALVGPRANWRRHAAALSACAESLGFPVVREKRAAL